MSNIKYQSVKNSIEQIKKVLFHINDETKNIVILVTDFNAKYQILRHIKTNEIKEAICLEKIVSSFYEIVELHKNPCIENIINITLNENIKPNLKINSTIQNYQIFEINNNLDIQLAVEKTKKTDNILEIFDIWFNIKRTDKISELLNNTYINKNIFFENLYNSISNTNITICEPETIPNKIFDTIIITNSNLEKYNSIMPYLSSKNYDIMPTKHSEPTWQFIVASNFIQSKQTILIKNEEIKEKSYLSFLYKSEIVNNNTNQNFTSVTTQNFIGSGKLIEKLTVNDLKKLSSNPFFFYIEKILKLKEIDQFKIKNKSANEIVIDELLNKQTTNKYISIFEKYKIKKYKQMAKNTKTICFKNKVYTKHTPVHKTINEIEIIANPDFSLSDKPYFFTELKSEKNITNNIDIQSLITLIIIKNASFINYKTSFILTELNNLPNQKILENFIDFYKKKGVYYNTQNNDSFKLSNQHITRNHLIQREFFD